MSKKNKHRQQPRGARSNAALRSKLHCGTILGGGCLGLLCGLLVNVPAAHAFNLYSGEQMGQDLEVNLDFTTEYSTLYRVNDPSAILTSNANGDEGERDFRHGFVDNTFDVLPVFDLKYGNFGAHVSGEAYVDPSYLDKNQNNSPGTFNPISPASNRDFTSATRNINGENAVLLDAFVYDHQTFGANDSQSATIKIGRQTLLWGQSLFFSQNGIAAGQAPLDIIKALSLPNAETQQVILPVGQVVATYKPTNWLTLQGYYQFEWEPFRLQGVGAYFSSTDLLDKGGQRLIAGPNFYLYRAKDNRPPINNGQFGASVQATLGAYDLGLYGLRYDAKTPEVYLGAPGVDNTAGPGDVGSYWLVYPRDIQIYGASVSTDLGSANVAGEISGRRNMPLDSGASPSAYPGPANAGALYAVGSTMAAQASFIYISSAIPLDPGGVSVDGEVAMNHVLSVDHGKQFLTAGRDSTAGQFDIVVTPNYYSVLPNLSLGFPIGFSYNLFGRSQISGGENHGTGTINFGVTATYLTTWIASATYQDYLGKPDPTLNNLADRGYLGLTLQHTF